MKQKLKDRIFASIVLIVFALLVVFISDSVALFYENRCEPVPKLLSLLLLAIFAYGVGHVYVVFMNAFSKKNNS